MLSFNLHWKLSIKDVWYNSWGSEFWRSGIMIRDKEGLNPSHHTVAAAIGRTTRKDFPSLQILRTWLADTLNHPSAEPSSCHKDLYNPRDYTTRRTSPMGLHSISLESIGLCFSVVLFSQEYLTILSSTKMPDELNLQISPLYLSHICM